MIDIMTDLVTRTLPRMLVLGGSKMLTQYNSSKDDCRRQPAGHQSARFAIMFLKCRNYFFRNFETQDKIRYGPTNSAVLMKSLQTFSSQNPGNNKHIMSS